MDSPQENEALLSCPWHATPTSVKLAVQVDPFDVNGCALCQSPSVRSSEHDDPEQSLMRTVNGADAQPSGGGWQDWRCRVSVHVPSMLGAGAGIGAATFGSATFGRSWRGPPAPPPTDPPPPDPSDADGTPGSVLICPHRVGSSAPLK